jgi:murein DD-endopeptidase MepM/ murein hydrolase activator NlpD
LALWFFLGIPGLAQAPAQPSLEDLQRYQQSLDQYQHQVSQQQDHLEQMQTSAQDNIVNLQLGLQSTRSALADNEYQLKLAQAKLQQLQTDLTATQNHYQAEQDKIISRLRWLQRQPRSQGWAALLHSQDLNEFFERRYRIKLLYESDRRHLTNLQTEYTAIQSQRLNVEGQKNEIALIRQQLLQQKSQFEQQTESQQTLVQRLRSDRLALEAAQNQLDQDSTRLKQLIQARIQAEGGPSFVLPRGNGRFRYPVVGPISSPFGWREHPILGTQRFHSGLDFAVDYGTPIGATAPGIVIFAGWYGGYGNAVILDHGGGVTTLYGHTEELLVSEGETVQGGQVIARAGSTGLSTGPHLHFEVREDGEPVDPANYL